MNPATITPVGTFKVTNGADVPGTVTMNATNTIAIFTPTAALPECNYTATVSVVARTPLYCIGQSRYMELYDQCRRLSLRRQSASSVLTNNFVILTQTGITNTGRYFCHTGNIGASPITAAAMSGVFCTEISGTIFGVDAAYVEVAL
jgi:hypothetical protein